ncbi:MAG: hypothetical protein R6U27_03760 [Desulfobacterales bacterium]
MKAEDKYDQILSEFQRNDLYELFYLAGLLLIPLIFRFAVETETFNKYETAVILMVFGLVIISASKILSFLFNLLWVIFPFSPKARPNLLKVIGLVCLGLSGMIGISKFF